MHNWYASPGPSPIEHGKELGKDELKKLQQIIEGDNGAVGGAGAVGAAYNGALLQGQLRSMVEVYHWMAKMESRSKSSLVIGKVASIVLSVGLSVFAHGYTLAQQTVPFAPGNRPLILDVHVAGQSRPFVVDLGATHVFIDNDEGAAQTKPILKTRDGWLLHPMPEMAIGTTPLIRDEFIVVMEMSHLQRVSGDLAGVVGCRVMNRHVWQFDFDTGTLIINPLTKQGERGAMAPSDDERPHIFCVVGGVREKFLLDTGATGCSLRSGLYDKLLRDGRIAPRKHGEYVVARGLIKSARGIADRLVVGQAEFQHVPITRRDTSKLGMDVLHRFQIVVDFVSRHVYLKPGKHVGDPFVLPGRCGLGLITTNEGIVVEDIDEGGVGQVAGFEIGDKILEIDGKKKHFDIFDVQNVLDRGAVHVVVERMGMRVDLRVPR